MLQGMTPQPDTHAGLWLDKYLSDDSDNAKKALVSEVAEIAESSILYGRFYQRWTNALNELGAECREAKSQGRLAMNLGNDAVLETSIALHRTYGMPYIPGSALKGLSSHYAMRRLEKDWAKDSRGFKVLFGDTTTAGYVTFYDALYIPGTGHNGSPLWPDVIAVHHPRYYRNEPEAPPADWDSPIPIPFLTATGSFLVALSGPEKWVDAAFDILKLALENEGIGAKTYSGYGRMTLGTVALNDTDLDQAESAASQGVLPTGYQRGRVKKFTGTYGFIEPEGGGDDVFVHVSDLTGGVDALRPGQQVVYRPGPGKKEGQTQAFDVRLGE
jgi:CRISPR-associated protein Cmr6